MLFCSSGQCFDGHFLILLTRNFTFLLHFTVTYRGDIYIFGGYNGQLKKHFSDMWKFDIGMFYLKCYHRLRFSLRAVFGYWEGEKRKKLQTQTSFFLSSPPQ